MTIANRWIVAGGGASGIATAFYLERAGFKTVIVEKSDVLGGRIGSMELGERLVDFGGKNIGRKYTLFREFAASMGDHPYEYFGVNSSQVRDGKIVTFESKQRYRSMLELARGASGRDLWRFGQLVARVKWNEDNGYLGGPGFRRLSEKYDDRPVSAHFGEEFCRRIIRPMSVRMNGAEPDEIYLGNLGSNIRMVLDSYDQLQNGMRPVLDEFSKRQEVRLGTAVRSLLIREGKVDGVRLENGVGEVEDLAADGVVLATAARISAGIVEPALPGLAGILGKIAYYPVALVLAEYDREIFKPEVRALILDENEPISNAGAYGVNDLHVVRYTFSGRTARAHMADGEEMESLLKRGEEALNQVFPMGQAERRGFVARQFEYGLCAYTPFHSAFLENLSRESGRVRGLHLTGDYVQGASIEACFRAARNCVGQITATGIGDR